MEHLTAQKYRSSLRTILKKTNINQSELVNIAICNPHEIRVLFMRAMRSMSRSSYSIYRQAIYDFLDSKDIDRESYDISGYSDDVDEKPKTKLKKYTENMRLSVIKKIESSDVSAIEDTDRFIVSHLLIGPYIGVRLTEYIGLKYNLLHIEDREVIEIYIKNGKFNEYRGNGEIRVIRVPNVVPATNRRRILISDHIDRIHTLIKIKGIAGLKDQRDKELMLKYIRSISNRHSKIIKDLFPDLKKIPTLTSVRHQYKIGVFLTGDSTLTAAAMGHSSVLTHKRNYGNRKGNPVLSEEESEFYGEITVSKENLSLVRVTDYQPYRKESNIKQASAKTKTRQKR